MLVIVSNTTCALYLDFLVLIYIVLFTIAIGAIIGIVFVVAVNVTMVLLYLYYNYARGFLSPCRMLC